jgi:hypothetical protein
VGIYLVSLLVGAAADSTLGPLLQAEVSSHQEPVSTLVDLILVVVVVARHQPLGVAEVAEGVESSVRVLLVRGSISVIRVPLSSTSARRLPVHSHRFLLVLRRGYLLLEI